MTLLRPAFHKDNGKQIKLDGHVARQSTPSPPNFLCSNDGDIEMDNYLLPTERPERRLAIRAAEASIFTRRIGVLYRYR